MITRPFYDDSIGLSRPMQQRLQTRIAQHHGWIEPVIAKVRAALVQLDADVEMQSDTNRLRFQSQRALLVAELDYLTRVVSHHQEQESARASMFWSRFRRPFQRTTVTD